MIELIIAVTLVGSTVVTLMTSVTGMSALHLQARDRAQMTELAEGKVEDLRGFAREGTPDTVQVAVGGSLTSGVVNHSDTVLSSEGRTYVRRWAVVPGPGGVRELTVRVLPLGSSAALDFATHVQSPE